MRQFKFPILLSFIVLLLSGLVLGLSKPEEHQTKTRDFALISPVKRTIDEKVLSVNSRHKQAITQAVKAYFEKAILSGEIVGAGVSIVQGNSMLISEGFGKRNIEADKEVDGQTIFRLGSLSKGFAGILAAKVVNEGKLNWSDKVIDYYPEFRLGDKGNTEQVTLAHLLSHTSGAPYHSFTNLVEAGMALDQIAGRFTEVQPVSGPGSVYSYQNALFALSGEIIAKATGEDFTMALQKRFFNPLEMCSTLMDYESLKKVENVAIPHTRWGNRWRSKKLNDHYDNAIAAGGINASALDMAKWMRLLLGHEPELINKAELEEVFKPVVEIPGRSKYYQRWPGHLTSHYGYGWRIHKFKEGEDQVKTMWHHGGSVNHFRNEIALYPEADLGICVLLNSNSSLAKNVIPDLYQIIAETLEEMPFEVASNHISE